MAEVISPLHQATRHMGALPARSSPSPTPMSLHSRDDGDGMMITPPPPRPTSPVAPDLTRAPSQTMNGLMKGWVFNKREQKFWCVVNNHHLCFYDSPDSEVAVDVVPIDGIVSFNAEPHPKQKGFRLSIRFHKQRDKSSKSSRRKSLKGSSTEDDSKKNPLGFLSPWFSKTTPPVDPNRRRRNWTDSVSKSWSLPSPDPKAALEEYILVAETRWEVEAWSEAIQETKVALVGAASNQQWELVQELLEAGREVDASEPCNGRLAIHYACGYGELQQVEMLLGYGAQLNAPDASGLTPVCYAAMKDQAALVEVLLQKGADPTVKAHTGRFGGKHALDIAQQCGCSEVESLLMQRMWFWLLVPEIKMLIFSRLDRASCANVQLTCREWTNIVQMGRQYACMTALPALPENRAKGINIEFALPSTLPTKPDGTPKHCLVLDMDETLLHSSIDPSTNADIKFQFMFGGSLHTMYVQKRPYLQQFFTHVLHSGAWEVVVFTASVRQYADKLLDLLDPNHEWIHHRLYREDCLRVDDNYLKDLSILGRDLKTTVIVDNMPFSFGYQVDNGIPIVSWFEDESDRELLTLLPLLDELAQQDDVRKVLRTRLHLSEVAQGWAHMQYKRE